MANPVAEAFVTIRPDFSVFNQQLQQGVSQGLAGIKVPQGTSRNLGNQLFGTGFRQQAQTSIAGGLQNVAVNPAAQKSFAQKLFGPGFRNEAGRAIQGTLVGLGGGQLAAQFAFFGAGGAALAVLGAALLKAGFDAAQFERTLDVLQATTGATTDQMDSLSKKAIQLGADVRLPAVTAQSAADAMNELAKAGLGVQDVLDGVTGVLQLSTAAQVSAAEAAQITAAALNAFNLSGREAVHVADLLAGASIAAQGDIHDMALALQQSSAVAHQVGLDVNQTVGYITLLAQAGIRGSDAGTSIRTSLLRLAPTTKESTALMKALGIEIDQTRTIGEQLPDLLDQYRVAFSGLSSVQQQQVLTQIAGTDAIRALSVAIAAGSDGFENATLEVDRAGTAMKLAQAQTKGLAGSAQGLASSTQTLALSVGQGLSPALKIGVDALNGMVSGINSANSAMNEMNDEANQLLKPLTDLAAKIDDAFGKKVEAFLFAGPGGKQIDEFLGGGDVMDEALGNLRDAGAFLDLALTKAIETRKELAAMGLPTATIDAQIKKLQGELRDLREETGTDIGLDLATPLDRSIASLKEWKKALELQGAPAAQIKAVQQQINFLNNDIARNAAQAAAKAEQRAKATNQLARALGLTPDQIAEITATVDREGPKAGLRLGKSYMRAVAQGITEEEGRAIAAAERALADVQRAGQEQIIESIRSARGNLESLADTLVSQSQEIIDVGPIQQRIEELQKSLDELQDTVSKRQLRFDLTRAKADLRDAKESLQEVGVLTPAQKREQREFLAPFQQKVKDAKSAIKEFDLQKAIDQQTKLKEAAKKAAEDGIQQLVADFEDGKISAGEFAKKLEQEVRPELDAISRRNLGLTIERDFLRNLQTIVDQAKALQGFLSTPGTTPGAQVVKPAATVAQVAQNTKDAADRLRFIREDAKKQSQDQLDEMEIQTGLLRSLVRLLKNEPSRGGGGGKKK